MADSDSDQKTEQATERHLEDAMDQGRFAKVPELSVLMIFVGGLAGLAFTAQSASERLAGFSVATFTGLASTPVRSDTAAALMSEIILVVGGVVLPFVAACAGAALLAGGLQTGFRLTPRVLGLNWDRLSPANGLGRVFSTRVLVHTAIDSLKLIAIGGSLYVGARTLVHDPLFGAPVETSYLGRFMYQSATALVTRIALSLGAIGAISYAYEKFKTAQELMMTRQEVKDERRSTEGDGMLKGAGAAWRAACCRSRCSQAVRHRRRRRHQPDPLRRRAQVRARRRTRPRSSSRRARTASRMRLKAIAAENGVPMVENKPVARVLFAMAKVGETIPSELYQAVAEILAVVYRTNRYYFHRLKSRRVETRQLSPCRTSLQQLRRAGCSQARRPVLHRRPVRHGPAADRCRCRRFCSTCSSRSTSGSRSSSCSRSSTSRIRRSSPAFPTLLLALTLFRLALNISSTRQILVHGYAGEIIQSFGHFVIQGNYIVGAVVFIILVVINFVVITKGAGRIAEVARPLHPRRHARQADGDRCRAERRDHRRGRRRPRAA